MTESLRGIAGRYTPVLRTHWNNAKVRILRFTSLRENGLHHTNNTCFFRKTSAFCGFFPCLGPVVWPLPLRCPTTPRCRPPAGLRLPSSHALAPIGSFAPSDILRCPHSGSLGHP